MCTIKQIDSKKVKLFIPKTAKKLEGYQHRYRTGMASNVTSLCYLKTHFTLNRVLDSKKELKNNYLAEVQTPYSIDERSRM